MGWTGLGGPAACMGRERLTSNEFEADLRLASIAATVGDTSPPPPLMTPGLPPSPPPAHTGAAVVVKDGGGFFTTLVNSAKKSVLGSDYINAQEIEPEEEAEQPDAIPLATKCSLIHLLFIKMHRI